MDSSIPDDSGEERVVNKLFLDTLEKELSGRTKEVFQMLRLYTQTYTAEKLGTSRRSIYRHLQKIKEIAHGLDGA